MEYFSSLAPEKVGNSLARGRQGQLQANSVRKLTNNLCDVLRQLDHYVITTTCRRTLRVEEEQSVIFIGVGYLTINRRLTAGTAVVPFGHSVDSTNVLF